MFAFWRELVTGCIIMTVVVTVVMEKQFYLLRKDYDRFCGVFKSH